VPAILRVVQGDISTFEGDVIINAANNHLRMGSGVAGAILAKGGGLIQDECDSIVRKQGPLNVGEAVATSAGNLSVKWIIHAAAMGDMPANPTSIRNAIRSAMTIAMEKEAIHIAVPIIGSGVGGFPFDEAARIIVEEVKLATGASAAMETVVFYGYTAEQAAALQRHLG
jgi:O-acetyl-ADP-ribose deacetylase (regulator of RNase III)